MKELDTSYQPGTRTARLMDEARGFNAGLDAVDGAGPLAKPSRCPLDVQLRTVLDALFCGMECEDWPTIAEGAAMLQDAELRVRGVLGKEGSS